MDETPVLSREAQPQIMNVKMFMRVFLDSSRERVTEVPVTPSTTCRDVVDYCKQPHLPRCYLAELWRGCERPLGEDEKPHDLLQQWGVHWKEVCFYLRTGSVATHTPYREEAKTNMGDGDVENRLPAGVDLTLTELQDMAARQQQQIQQQQQQLVAKEQRLRFLRQQETRHTQLASEGERLRQLRERVEQQEAKLQRLKALRGSATDITNTNSSLSSELESIKSLFNEKEKELTDAVTKVEQLSWQLDELRQGKVVPPGESSESGVVVVAAAQAELARLKQQLQEQNKLNEYHSTELQSQSSMLQQRRSEMSQMDRRVAELQARLKRRQALQTRPSTQPSTSSSSRVGNANVATIEPYVPAREGSVDNQAGGTSGLNKQDPKYQTLPHSIKFPSSGSKVMGTTPYSILGRKNLESNNNETKLVNGGDGRNGTNPSMAGTLPYRPTFSASQSQPRSAASLISNFAPRPYGSSYSTSKLGVSTGFREDPKSMSDNTYPKTSTPVVPQSSTSNLRQSTVSPPPVYPTELQYTGPPTSQTSTANIGSASQRLTGKPSQTSQSQLPNTQPPYTKPSISQPPQTQPSHSQPPHSQLPFSHGPFSHPSHTQPSTSQPPHSHSSHPQPQFKPPHSQPQHTQPPASQTVTAPSAAATTSSDFKSTQPQRTLTSQGQSLNTVSTTTPSSSQQPTDTSDAAVDSALSVLTGSSGTSSSKPTYRYAPKSVIANTYMRRLGSGAMDQYRRNMSQLYGQNFPSVPAAGEGESQGSDSSQPQPATTTGTTSSSQGPPSPIKENQAYTGRDSSPYNIDPIRYRPNAPRPLRRRLSSDTSYDGHPKNATVFIPSTDTDEDVHPKTSSGYAVTTTVEIQGSSNEKSIPLTHISTAERPPSAPTTSQISDDNKSQAPSSNKGPAALLRKKTSLKKKDSVKSSRRVSFDPLALLLDASLEGELELVMRTAKEVHDPSASNDEGITALHNAICAGHFEIVKFLVKHGCNVNAPDSDGWTPLHCAASCNNLPMVKVLVDHGACIFATTISDHETAAEKCEEDEDGYDGCSQYLYSIQEKLGIMNGGQVFAVFDYQSQNTDELSFTDGTQLTVLRKGDESEVEWWWGRNGSSEGYIPRNLLGLHRRVPPPWNSTRNASPEK